jgi:serine/threonine protein kinase
MRVALGIAQGMAYLHGRHPCVVHGDLKPDNVMLSDTLHVKIIDFGDILRMLYIYECSFFYFFLY